MVSNSAASSRSKDLPYYSRREARPRQKPQREKSKSMGRVEPVALDVSEPRSIERAADEISKRHDHLDVLINNAAINYDTWETAENADINGTVTETITTNLLGPWPRLPGVSAALAQESSWPNRQRVIGIGVARAHERWSSCISGHQGSSERVHAHTCRRTSWLANSCERSVSRLGGH